MSYRKAWKEFDIFEKGSLAMKGLGAYKGEISDAFVNREGEKPRKRYGRNRV